MKFITRIFINFIIILLTEKFYFQEHMKLKYNSGTLFTGIVVPSIIILVVLLAINYMINKINKFYLSFNLNVISWLIGIIILMLFWLIKSLEITKEIFIGEEIPNLIVTSILFVSSIIILLIKFCIVKFING